MHRTTRLVGLIVGLAGRPGDGLGKEKQSTLGKLLVETEKRSDRTAEADGFNMKSFVSMLIPTNIFDALYHEKNLQVLFFSVVFGIGVGLIRSPASGHILAAGETIFKAFEKAISWSLYALPFGLMSIMAVQIAQTGVTVMIAMAKFIMLTYAAAIILIAISSAAIWYATGKSVVKSFADLKEPLLIAFGTRSSYAAMPSLFQSLRDEFSLEPQAIHLIVPLNIVICRYSMVLVYTLGTVFAAQLYGVPFGIFSFVLALFGAVIAALAGAGSPAVAALSMISIVLGMFGLPSGTAIILILAIITMIDPILTVINVHLACSSALFITKPAGTPKDSADMSAVGTTV
ncbi:hypothetical protein SD70_21785 [Gordoniibacillus kamchatkensis]|uniref:Sodium:dicarboxylate symporter n=1 Tax=Gordoniibacillus kamchatkensis TaxID=1590651 RepID=A0ABR5AF34_9BACL|nr:cation:dicarboxylase symporter family transporter [Paenibacillus sp. VKM B-2647]KIL39175.1 hypothetical protein SD70_21785 [Paenibacillus sp. VKM B-2647]